MNSKITIEPTEAMAIIEEVLKTRPTVANLSVQYHYGVLPNIVKLIEKKVHVVIAAGNDNLPMTKDSFKEDIEESKKDYFDDIIFVGASSPDDKIWGYTSPINYESGSMYGPIIDVFAPGDSITSAIHSKKKGEGLSGTDEWNGTSFAAPHVTGIIACLLSHPNYKNLTPKEMKTKILEMAWDDAIKPVDDIHLVKKVLALELWQMLRRLCSNKDETLTSEYLETKFKENGESLVTAAYMDILWEEVNLLKGKTEVKMSEYKKILPNNSRFIERKIESIAVTLSGQHFAEKTSELFKTTRKLASCHLKKWNDEEFDEDKKFEEEESEDEESEDLGK